jgi:hypothetical protein
VNGASMSSFMAAAELTDYDGPEDTFTVLKSETKTARKWHHCEGCEWVISPGQKYDRTAGLDEGKFVVLKVHADQEQCRQAERDRLAYEQGRASETAEEAGEREAQAKAHTEAFWNDPENHPF